MKRNTNGEVIFTIVRRVSAIFIIIFRVLWKYVRLLSTHQTCRWLYIYPTVAIQRALAGGQQQTPFLIKQYWLVLSILLPGCFNKQHISWKELAWRTWNRICICDKVIHRNVFKCAVKHIHVFFQYKSKGLPFDIGEFDTKLIERSTFTKLQAYLDDIYLHKYATWHDKAHITANINITR